MPGVTLVRLSARLLTVVPGLLAEMLKEYQKSCPFWTDCKTCSAHVPGMSALKEIRSVPPTPPSTPNTRWTPLGSFSAML